jgi:flagellar hook-associated protein 1
VNELGGQIAQYNTQIVSAESSGNSANDLRDARDRLLDQLSKVAGGQVVERSNGAAEVYISGHMIVDGATAKPLQMVNGQPPSVTFPGAAGSLVGVGGTLGAEMTLSGTHIPDVMAKLDSLAKGVVQSVNAIHSTGKIYSGSPPVAATAGNFFDVTTPPPAGVDPLLTARGMRLASTMTDSTAVAVSGPSSIGPGNNDVALAIAGLQTSAQTITSAGGATIATAALGDFYNSIVGDLATTTSQAEDDSTVKSTLMSNADTRRQSTSGVSTDEELISVIQHQHAYQAAARLVNTVDEMMQTLISLGQ